MKPRKLRDIRERFFEKTCPEPNSGCLLWVGACDVHGYGVFSVVGKRYGVRAHRMAWVLANGSIPDGMHVLHHCDVTLCVNIRHLYLGRDAENRRDMAVRGRGHTSKRGLPYGAVPRRKNYHARITYNGKSHHLGVFATAGEASAAALEFKRKIYDK